MVAAVAAVIAIALVLDRDEPASEHAAVRAKPPATLRDADVARIVRRVERLRRLRFERPVKPVFLGRVQVERFAEEEGRADYPDSERRADEESLKLLGLIRPEDSLAKAFTAIGREQILGFYDQRRKRLVVVREPGTNRTLLEITLAHELVHALEDQHFGFGKRRDPNDDAELAEAALAEGSATQVMVDYAIRHFGSSDALALLDTTSGTDTKLPKYVEDALLFPYVAGLEFVETFRGERGSWRALDNVYRFRRPATAEQVLHIDKYAVDERPAPVRMPDLGLALGAGWQRLGESSVGEVDLREMFAIIGRKPNPRAAAGWGGGQFELWRRSAAEPCAAPCVSHDVGLMKLVWDTAADRRAAERALARAFPKGLRARPAGRRNGVRLWSSRGGAIAMRGGAKQTAIVFAPDIGVAVRVLSAA